MITILGLSDASILGAYLSCIIITLICVIYGALNLYKEKVYEDFPFFIFFIYMNIFLKNSFFRMSLVCL